MQGVCHFHRSYGLIDVHSTSYYRALCNRVAELMRQHPTGYWSTGRADGKASFDSVELLQSRLPGAQRSARSHLADSVDGEEGPCKIALFANPHASCSGWRLSPPRKYC